MKKSFFTTSASIFALTLAASSLSSCGPQNVSGDAGGNDAQYIRAIGDKSKTLVALNVVPGVGSKPKSLGELSNVFVLSCGYELQSGLADDAKVSPINRFAHSTPVAQFNKAAKETAGGIVMFLGAAAGTVLLVASAADVDPDRGMFIALGGVVSWLTSFFVGSPMLAGATQDNNLLHQRAAVFAQMTSGVNEKIPEFYKDNKDTVRGSGNTPIPCVPQKASALRLIIKGSR